MAPFHCLFLFFLFMALQVRAVGGAPLRAQGADKDGGVPDYPVQQLDLGVKPLERRGHVTVGQSISASQPYSRTEALIDGTGLPRPNYTVEEGKFSEDLELFRKLQEDLGRKIDMVNYSGDADQNTESLSWPQKVLEYFVDSMVHLVVSVPFVIVLLCVTKWYWKKGREDTEATASRSLTDNCSQTDICIQGPTPQLESLITEP